LLQDALLLFIRVVWNPKGMAALSASAVRGLSHNASKPRGAVNWLDRRADRFRRIAAVLFAPALAV
jgi:hypothetical protein